VVGAAIVAGAAILWLARTYTFYFDEWDFILSAPDWDFDSYFRPHNEHLVVLPRLVYAALFATAGLRTYLPYMATLLFLHAANAVLVFEIVRRRQGDLIGLACAVLLLVIGAGWEDLLWAFQIAFVGAVTCGLAAVLVLTWDRTSKTVVLAVLLLAAAVMFSGIGLFFGVTVAVRLILDPARRRDLLWFAPAGIAFVVWELTIGRGGAAPVPPPGAGNLLALPAYLAWGLGASVGGIIGVTDWPQFIALAIAVAAIAVTWWRRRPDPLALGIAAGLLAFYVVTGMTRAQMGYQQSGAGRYVYVGAVFWLILLADAAGALPWRGTWRPALVACLFLACFNSGVLLFSYAAGKTVLMQREWADLQALSAVRNDSCLNPNGAVDPLVMPWVTGPAAYYRAVDRYGAPAAAFPITDRVDYEAALHNLRKTGC
jgi:hypothetical protein